MISPGHDQVKITSLIWFETWAPIFVVSFSELSEQFYFARSSCWLITPCSLLPPTQILAELQWDTRPSAQDVPSRDPGTVLLDPVSLNPAGKVFNRVYTRETKFCRFLASNAVTVSIPLKHRNFFRVNFQSLKLKLPLRRSYPHLNLH